MTALVFSGRMQFLNKDGTLSREAIAFLQALLDRTGGTTGDVLASSVVNAPNGSIAAVNVQAAIDELDTEKQPKDATLTALAALVVAADKLIYATGADAFALADLTAFARTLLDDANAAAARATLGLVIGTNVQAYDADLDTWAGKTAPAGTVVGTSDSQALTNKTIDSSPIGTTTPDSGKFTAVESTTYVKTAISTVALLPSAVTAGAGARHFVTNANSTTFASVVAGGGANKVPVYSDGTNWLIG